MPINWQNAISAATAATAATANWQASTNGDGLLICNASNATVQIGTYAITSTTNLGGVIYIPDGVSRWPVAPQPRLTDEQLAEQRRRWESAEMQRREEVVKAEATADELLREVLAEDEYRGYKTFGHVDVASQLAPGVVYRVRKHRRIGIVRHGVEFSESLCVHPEDEMAADWPEGDLIAAHVLLCKFNEKTLLATANRQPYAA